MTIKVLAPNVKFPSGKYVHVKGSAYRSDVICGKVPFWHTGKLTTESVSCPHCIKILLNRQNGG